MCGGEDLTEETGGVAEGTVGDLLGGAGGKDLSTFTTALGSHVDNPVGELDDIKVVLDDDDGVASIDKFLQDIHQDSDVLEMQAGGGLVENVERLAGVFLREFGGQFDSLAFSTRKGGGGLAKFDVAEAYILDGLDLAEDLGHVLEELDGLIDGHVEHVGNRLAFIAHFERFTVVTLAVALLARHLDIGQEVHLDGLVTIAATGLASPAFHVERETARLVASYLGFGQVDEQGTDIGENTGVGGGIGTGCSSDGTLVDIHYLVDMF